MADSRHKHAAPRPARRTLRTSRSARAAVLPLAGLLAIGGVVGVAAAQEGGSPAAEAGATIPQQPPKKDVFAASVSSGQAPATVSRSAERPPLPNAAAVEDKIKGELYAKSDLDIHAAAKKSSPVLAEVESGDTVEVTGKRSDGWAEIMHKGLPRWVDASSITTQKPVEETSPETSDDEAPEAATSGGLSTAPCAAGSGPESGLQPDTIKVYRAVCAKFPSIVSYGGVAGRGEHGTGQALDIMISSDLGNQVAAFLQQNRTALGVDYLIWRQRIWRPATSPDWRGMSDRGSPTANHMDHVHVTTYGNAATG
ncbi:SH3 domain-containing protein [Aeromicrobium yanjiei]|uniref:SH3 domain-containing protein n=1 Tax=Aeromicrobium yanjiei TaxID=2662028 RepID=A0A5Q2MDJ7_9ACTN|nr:SH3 domain-containing protein [Aeromicrobium yanjiei]QGG41177.1 SH3 domain-containing protein [Aeromicrobium yanjiei]